MGNRDSAQMQPLGRSEVQLPWDVRELKEKATEYHPVGFLVLPALVFPRSCLRVRQDSVCKGIFYFSRDYWGSDECIFLLFLFSLEICVVI